MSDSPLTDAAARECDRRGDIEPLDQHARRMERDRSRLIEALQRIADYDAPDARAMIAQARALLREMENPD